MKVKPGCAITDVARPLDLPAEEVARRRDVLVIESGAIQLPGKVSMKNIGLPPNVAYACLAETIVLALAARAKAATPSRGGRSRVVQPRVNARRSRTKARMISTLTAMAAGLRSTEDSIAIPCSAKA